MKRQKDFAHQICIFTNPTLTVYSKYLPYLFSQGLYATVAWSIYMNTCGGPAGWGSGKFHISWDFEECFNNLTQLH